MDEKTKKEIFQENYFPYQFMNVDERDFCLKILSNCKDISDSNYKVNGTSKCDIVEMRFKKENNIIHANGSLTIGDKDNQENRCVDADIFITKDNIIVDMLVTRLMVKDENKEYRVLDEFKLEDDVLKRRSFYTYDMKSIYDSIENDEMKGRLR